MRLPKKSAVRSTKAWGSEQPWLDKMAAPIAGLGIKLQQAFAGCMSRLTGKLSLKRLQTALVVFCLLCGSFSGYLVITAILGPNGGTTRLKVEAVQTPKHVSKGSEGMILPNPSADVRVARKIRAFRVYMDSLRRAAPSLYDSIHRRGLWDSLTQVEKIYPSQPLK